MYTALDTNMVTKYPNIFVLKHPNIFLQYFMMFVDTMDTLKVKGTHDRAFKYMYLHMSHFSYACKTEGENGISRLISSLCINCLSAIPEYSRLNHLDVHLV